MRIVASVIVLALALGGLALTIGSILKAAYGKEEEQAEAGWLALLFFLLTMLVAGGGGSLISSIH